MAIIFNGKKFAEKKEKLVKKAVTNLKQKGVFPKLASILVGNNPASILYVGLKKKAATRVGAELDTYFLPEKTTKDTIYQLIDSLNKDKTVNGIMIQLPLPESLKGYKEEIINMIDPKKDVDGLRENSKYLHPTSKAVIQILNDAKEQLESKVNKVCIVGSTGMVGAPLLKELKSEGYDVSGCNKETKNLKSHTLGSDILISTSGVSGILKKDMVKEDSIVIDVGSPKGDVDFNESKSKSAFITPVPGGVGPVTIVCLLENLLEACYTTDRI